ncbi:MAG: HPr family phosphocarrier protein [Pseudohongiellaceae bacterium]
MRKTTVKISNKAGLHARAASKLVSVATAYRCDVQIGADKLVDGKSILALMMLAAVKGTTLNVIADGEDEEHALKAIVELINNRFDEAQ